MQSNNDIPFKQPTSDSPNNANELTVLSILTNEVIRRQKESEEYKKQIEDMQTELNSLKKEVQQSKDNIEDAKDNIKSVQNKTLEPLAVFVGLFTFVSVGFNIFSNVTDTSVWISLLLIILGALIIFSALVIHAGSLDNRDKSRKWWTASLILVGLILLAIGSFLHNKYIETSVSQTKQDSDSQILDK